MDTDLLWKTFGAWAFSTGLLMLAVGWLVKELAASRAREARRADEMLELAKTVLPALEKSSEAVRESLDYQRRQGQALAACEVLIRDAERRGK